jgi:PAS domain-containing protein
MGTALLLAASAAIQFTAAVLALRLMRTTGRRTAWALIAIAVLLMGIRRTVTLVRVLGGDAQPSVDPLAEWIALAISLMMLVGIARMRPFFGRVERSEEAVRRSEARLRQIIDLVPHMIFAKDQNGRFLLANRAVAEAYGRTVKELIGRPQSEFQADEEELARMLADDREVMNAGQPKFVPEESAPTPSWSSSPPRPPMTSRRRCVPSSAFSSCWRRRPRVGSEPEASSTCTRPWRAASACRR